MDEQIVTEPNGREPFLSGSHLPQKYEAWFCHYKGPDKGKILCLGIFDDKDAAIDALLRINRYQLGEEGVTWNGYYVDIDIDIHGYANLNGGFVWEYGKPKR